MITVRKHMSTQARRLFFVLLLTVLCASCSPRIIERIRVEHDTLTVHHRDSLYLKDSVYIREYLKGDTVFIEKYKDRYIFRDRWRDSVQVREVHDTTAVEVKVEKSLSWAQKAKIGLFPWLLLAVIGLLLWTFRKFLF